MSPRVYRSTYPYPTPSEEETAVCLRIQRRHAPVKALQSCLQWTFRMMSGPHTPFFQVVQCLCLAQRATWSGRHQDRDHVLHDAKGTIREAYSRFIEK